MPQKCKYWIELSEQLREHQSSFEAIKRAILRKQTHKRTSLLLDSCVGESCWAVTTCQCFACFSIPNSNFISAKKLEKVEKEINFFALFFLQICLYQILKHTANERYKILIRFPMPYYYNYTEGFSHTYFILYFIPVKSLLEKGCVCIFPKMKTLIPSIVNKKAILRKQKIWKNCCSNPTQQCFCQAVSIAHASLGQIHF